MCANGVVRPAQWTSNGVLAYPVRKLPRTFCFLFLRPRRALDSWVFGALAIEAIGACGSTDNSTTTSHGTTAMMMSTNVTKTVTIPVWVVEIAATCSHRCYFCFRHLRSLKLATCKAKTLTCLDSVSPVLHFLQARRLGKRRWSHSHLSWLPHLRNEPAVCRVSDVVCLTPKHWYNCRMNDAKTRRPPLLWTGFRVAGGSRRPYHR